jgi:hypothetical protein
VKRLILASTLLALVSACDKAQDTTVTDDAPASATESKAPQSKGAMTGPMSFFITSIGVGNGANLGGLEGADEHCQNLADDAGAGDKTWRAYLSTTGRYDRNNPENNAASVHARDRIGQGPWFNAKGELIARDVAHLHSNNNINKQTALNEKGEIVNGRGDKPNQHDILTGSRPDGTAFSPHVNFTCKNWWSNDEGAAAVGHHDRTGPMEDNWAKSWNFSHFSRGCSQKALESSGGAGLLYCFAID